MRVYVKEIPVAERAGNGVSVFVHSALRFSPLLRQLGARTLVLNASLSFFLRKSHTARHNGRNCWQKYVLG